MCVRRVPFFGVNFLPCLSSSFGWEDWKEMEYVGGCGMYLLLQEKGFSPHPKNFYFFWTPPTKTLKKTYFRIAHL